MKFNLFMPRPLRPFFQEELKAYETALTQGALQQAWQHLERAHVIGQAYPYAHSLAHWKMLRFGIKIKSWKETAGQIPRLLVGGVKSFVGKIPAGNTGGANVPPLKPLPISPELQAIFAKAGVRPPGQ